MAGVTITLRIQSHRGFRLAADLLVPSGRGPFPAVVCTHDTLDDRGSPSNRQLAETLAGEGIAVMLLDLTGQGQSEGALEEGTPERQMEDVGAALEELERRAEIAMDRVGAYGAGTGALPVVLRADGDPRLRALVLRSPLSEGVFDAIRRVALPTLLIVGAEDRTALEESIALQETLAGEKRVAVVPEIDSRQGDLTYLQQAAILAADWFKDHLR